MSFLDKILGDPNAREVKRVQPLVSKINDFEEDVKKLSDTKLKEQTEQFRGRIEKGEALDKLLPEVFATVREAARRTIGQRHFDVQLIGGISAELRQGSRSPKR